MRKHQWVPRHRHTNPLDGGALPREAVPIVEEDGCAPCPSDVPFVPPVDSGPCGDGTIELTIASGSDLSAESFTIAAGQRVMILKITRDVTWLGSSVWDYWFDSAGSTAPISGTPHPLEAANSGPVSDPTHSYGTWLANEYDPPDSMYALPRGTAPESGTWTVDGSGISPLYLGYWDASGGGGYVIAPGTYHLRAGNLLDGYFSASGYSGSVCVIVSDDELADFVVPTSSEVDTPPPGQAVEDETTTPDPDGVTTVFTTEFTYAPRSLHVMFNGTELDSGVDFTETTSTTFTFNDPPPTDAQIVVWYVAWV